MGEKWTTSGTSLFVMHTVRGFEGKTKRVKKFTLQVMPGNFVSQAEALALAAELAAFLNDRDAKPEAENTQEVQKSVD